MINGLAQLSNTPEIPGSRMGGDTNPWKGCVKIILLYKLCEEGRVIFFQADTDTIIW